MRTYLFFLLFLPLPFLSFFRPWIGMLIWGWLALLNPHRDLWGFASTLPYNMIIAAATLAGWIASGEIRKLRLDLTSGLLILLWALMTVSTIFSLAPEQSWPKWDEFSKIILYALVLQSFLTTRTRIHTLIWLLVLCLGFYGVKGGTLFIVSGGSHQFAGPPGTMIGDRNELALAILMVVPMMNYLRLHAAHAWVRLGLLAAMLLSVLAVVGTYSRGGFIGLIVLGVMIWIRSHHKLPGLLLVGAVAALVAYAAPSAWLDRMGTIQTAEQSDDSFKSRLVAWQTYLAAARDRPLVGAGPQALNSSQIFFRYQPYETGVDYQNTVARAAHSIYFQVMGELGFVSFAVYILLSFSSLYHSERYHPLHAATSTVNYWQFNLSRMIQVSLLCFFTSGAALSMAFYDLFFVSLIINAVINGRRPALSFNSLAIPTPTHQPLAL